VGDARSFLASLVGRTLRTVSGRENRILEIDGDRVCVWTSRSPAGQLVPVAWVQEALDRLERDGEIEISVASVGYRSAFIGAVLQELPGAGVVRSGSPPRIRLTRDLAPARSTVASRVILLGCVKLKVDHRAASKDLYRSPLWKGRRAYAEAGGHPWMILSARHGLVDPEQPLAPYDLALTDLDSRAQRAWGERVADALERRFGDLTGAVFEIHAGDAYRRAVEPGVLARGGRLEAPLRGLPLGSQLAWYASRSIAPPPSQATLRRQASTAAEYRAAMRALASAAARVPARDWPDGLSRLDYPGLYSWWVNDAGAAELSDGLGHQIHAGRINAGQTGATKWPSGTTGAATLASRIGSNHLRGRIRGSTFRLTLAACLLPPLALVQHGPRRLDPRSEARLSARMRDRLEVAVFAVVDRDSLADLEHRVLSDLDPPLNLDGMRPTPLRAQLTRLRARLA
jgi:hypothetical protein